MKFVMTYKFISGEDSEIITKLLSMDYFPLMRVPDAELRAKRVVNMLGLDEKVTPSGNTYTLIDIKHLPNNTYDVLYRYLGYITLSGYSAIKCRKDGCANTIQLAEALGTGGLCPSCANFHI